MFYSWYFNANTFSKVLHYKSLPELLSSRRDFKGVAIEKTFRSVLYRPDLSNVFFRIIFQNLFYSTNCPKKIFFWEDILKAVLLGRHFKRLSIKKVFLKIFYWGFKHSMCILYRKLSNYSSIQRSFQSCSSEPI